MEPTSQKRKTSKVFASIRTSMLVMAVSNAARVVPTTANITRAELLMSRRPKANTMVAATPAPTNAATTIAVEDTVPMMKTVIATPRDAPALTPKRPGSASGLRVWPCMRAPPSPRQAPAARPSSVRGTRWLVMTVALSLSRPPNSAPMISEGGMARLPTERLPMTVIASIARRSEIATAVGTLRRRR